MKQIIDGKKYNTETAKKLCVNCNGYPSDDIQYLNEVLYQKNSGEFFLHGQGGVFTEYSKEVGLDKWAYGERIKPLSENQARNWAEKYMTVDEFEAIFGEVEE